MNPAWAVYRGVMPLLGWVAPMAGAFIPGDQRPFWPERLARAALHPADVWIHAASLGEAGAVGPLLQCLENASPGGRFQLTATTLTGRERLAASGSCVSLAPLDLPQATRRFLDQVRPRLVLIVETELWPQWLLESQRRGVPLVVVSARMSERSLRGYRRLGGGLRALAAGIRGVLAQTHEDAQRWCSLGVPSDRVTVVGNLKDDGLPQPASDRAQARRALGLEPGRPLLVLGSVRPGEAKRLAVAWQQQTPALRERWQVVALPRHAAGLAGLRAEAAEARDWRWESRMGVLNAYYRAAEVAFVGGSLEPYGGHNPMEPAATGAAVLMGPHGATQQAGIEALRGADAIEIVRTQDELEGAMTRLLESEGERERAGRAALAVAAGLRGAAKRTVEWLKTESLWPLR